MLPGPTIAAVARPPALGGEEHLEVRHGLGEHRWQPGVRAASGGPVPRGTGLGALHDDGVDLLLLDAEAPQCVSRIGHHLGELVAVLGK